MKTVHHFPTPYSFKPFKIPGIRVVHFGVRQGKYTVWVERMAKDIDQPYENKLRLMVVGTGHNFGPPDRWDHVQSFVDRNSFVWHLYQDNDPYWYLYQEDDEDGDEA